MLSKRTEERSFGAVGVGLQKLFPPTLSPKLPPETSGWLGAQFKDRESNPLPFNTGGS